jgi:hypothetical protein
LGKIKSQLEEDLWHSQKKADMLDSLKDQNDKMIEQIGKLKGEINEKESERVIMDNEIKRLKH